MRTAVEGSVDLPVVVAILFEDVPQEHQLSLQAVFITESSGPVHQSREYSLFIGWVMMGIDIGVEIGVCGLAVHFVSQISWKSRKGEGAFTFASLLILPVPHTISSQRASAASSANVPSSPILSPDDGGDTFLQNFGSYRRRTA
jgi:hypothetical protein